MFRDKNNINKGEGTRRLLQLDLVYTTGVKISIPLLSPPERAGVNSS